MSSSEQRADSPDPVLAPLVLIAEDEEPISLVLADLLEAAGYRTRIALNGQQALELARAEHPALILTDLMMPHLNGRELIATLRAQGHLSAERVPPIILMSAAGRAYTSDTGADAVLHKPFTLEEVEALLQRFLPPLAPAQ